MHVRTRSELVGTLFYVYLLFICRLHGVHFHFWGQGRRSLFRFCLCQPRARAVATKASGLMYAYTAPVVGMVQYIVRGARNVYAHRCKPFHRQGGTQEKLHVCAE